LKILCFHCGKFFEGEKEKFCSDSCFKSHIAELARLTAEAVRNDLGHTENLSKKS
jgi:hypothetical protein